MKGKSAKWLAFGLLSAAALFLYRTASRAPQPPGPERVVPSASGGRPVPPRPPAPRPRTEVRPPETIAPDFSARLANLRQIVAESAGLAQLHIRVPSESLELGLSSKSYQCWKLELSTARGREVRGLMLRLQSLRSAAAEVRDRLAGGLERYSASPEEKARAQLTANGDGLKALLDAFEQLRLSGENAGYLAPSKSVHVLWMGFGGAALSPKMEGNDYVMKYDPSHPACSLTPNPSPPRGRG